VEDDRVAFVGGLDFTQRRWDTSEHRPGDPRRRDLDDTIPQPCHDVRMMVSGAVAGALGELARERWQRAPGAGRDTDPWPGDSTADITALDAAIARTFPGHKDQPEIREVEALLVDACRAARQTPRCARDC
jgi:phosphatidylserine/phosphatidylglycerophosphate/cardiolipin synthase-like enzyme